MKKKIVMAVGTIAAVAILGIGIYHSNASQMDSGLSKEKVEEMVTEQYPGEITAINLVKQANKTVYMVDIADGVRQYALTLDSDTGDVVKLEETSDPEQVKAAEEKEQQANKKKQDDQKKETDNSNHKKKPSEKQESGKKPKPAEKKKTVISVERAIEIALEQFSGEVDEVELEEEDGRLIYEIEIEKGDDEAEVEIDAYTGEVLVVSIEKDD
jgi:uncharacterized membrane protein YkoI